MKYAITTLGCKVNQYETQAVETLLRDRGHAPTAAGDADVVIVNTCAVTAESGRKSRQAIRRLQGENPGAATVVCGCFSQISPEEVRALGADLVFGSDRREEMVEAIETLLARREGQGRLFLDEPRKRRDFEELPAGAVAGRTRAMLKIQDGCDNFCTYCIIPYSRGRVRSLPAARAAAQAAALAAEGYREIVVTGIEIASYGKDLPGRPGLAEVMEAIAAAAPGLRLRLGSLEPTVVTEDFCSRLAALGTVCGQFHLSLQSGCDRTLRAMGRKYDTAAFLAAAERLRRNFPGCALTADLIVGFPGETEADHAETLAFLRKVGFASMHVFPYSIRPGTRAAAMAGQLTHGVKNARAASARAVAEETRRCYLESCLGKTLSVLFETERDGLCVGHGENGVQVSAHGGQLRGLVKNVKIQGIQGEMLVGNIVAIPDSPC